jgi:hypothetical protein
MSDWLNLSELQRNSIHQHQTKSIEHFFNYYHPISNWQVLFIVDKLKFPTDENDIKCQVEKCPGWAP